MWLVWRISSAITMSDTCRNFLWTVVSTDPWGVCSTTYYTAKPDARCGTHSTIHDAAWNYMYKYISELLCHIYAFCVSLIISVLNNKQNRIIRIKFFAIRFVYGKICRYIYLSFVYLFTQDFILICRQAETRQAGTCAGVYNYTYICRTVSSEAIIHRRIPLYSAVPTQTVVARAFTPS